MTTVAIDNGAAAAEPEGEEEGATEEEKDCSNHADVEDTIEQEDSSPLSVNTGVDNWVLAYGRKLVGSKD